MHNDFNCNAIYNFLEMKITTISKNEQTLNLITVTQLLGGHDPFLTKQEEKPVFQKIPEYNAALQKMCDENQIAFLDNTSLVSDTYYEEDGIHFKADFYPIWLKRMAEVATL